MSVSPTAAEILGRPPWSDDQIARASSDFTGIHRAFHVHPGYRAHAELEQLSLSKRLFGKAVLELQSAVEAFLAHSITPGFRTRKLEAESADLTLSVQAALFQALATALAFRDRARTLAKRLSVPGFEEHFEPMFEQDKRSQFVSELRDHFSHVAPLVAEWELSQAGRAAPKVAKFLLQVADLDEAMKQDRNGWHSLAREFVDDHRASKTIDVVLLFADHSNELQKLHDWLYPATEVVAGANLIEYRDVEKRFNRMTMRIGWNAWVIPWMNQSDPRFVLDQYLTDNEINVVNSLSADSRGQVDQIIAFLDAEHSFMDDEMKRAIYKRFGTERNT
jgi:hypothetical protein